MLTGVELLNNSFHCTKKTERVASFSYLLHACTLLKIELVSGPSATKFFTSLEIGISIYILIKKDKFRLLEHQMLLYFSVFFQWQELNVAWLCNVF